MASSDVALGALAALLDPQLAVLAALPLLGGLLHPRALPLLLGEGGALLLRTHGQPLWSTAEEFTHHVVVPVQTLTLATSDGVILEAERATPAGASRASVVLCHPHPQYGGTMRSIVIGALFDALPADGFTVLRFNFRGVERSTGAHDDGEGELLDVQAAVDAAADDRAPTDEPLVLAGWSFGADMTLATVDAAARGMGGDRSPAAVPHRLRRRSRTTRARSCSCSASTTSSASRRRWSTRPTTGTRPRST